MRGRGAEPTDLMLRYQAVLESRLRELCWGRTGSREKNLRHTCSAPWRGGQQDLGPKIAHQEMKQNCAKGGSSG